MVSKAPITFRAPSRSSAVTRSTPNRPNQRWKSASPNPRTVRISSMKAGGRLVAPHSLRGSAIVLTVHSNEQLAGLVPALSTQDSVTRHAFEQPPRDGIADAETPLQLTARTAPVVQHDLDRGVVELFNIQILHLSDQHLAGPAAAVWTHDSVRHQAFDHAACASVPDPQPPF